MLLQHSNVGVQPNVCSRQSVVAPPPAITSNRRGRSSKASPITARAARGVNPALVVGAGSQQRRASRPVRAAASSADAPTSSSSQVYDTVIVGGGLSGLVAGQALAAKHGIRNFLVTEARERVGGNVTSLEGDGYIWEEGPNSFQPSDSMLQIAVSWVWDISAHNNLR